ncbi:TetR/AcrR family transcriptional regulator [Telluria sp. B2]
MKKSEARRQAILDAATDVFHESGFDRASMSDICNRVGYSKATVYGYFKSKEELLVAIALVAAEAEFEVARAALEEPVADLGAALAHFGRRFLGFTCSPEALAMRRLTLAEAPRAGLGNECYDLGPGRVTALLAALLHDAMEAGHLRVAGSELAARHLKALLDAEWGERLLYRTLDAPSSEQIEGAAERAVAAFMAAYRPAAARRPD